MTDEQQFEPIRDAELARLCDVAHDERFSTEYFGLTTRMCWDHVIARLRAAEARALAATAPGVESDDRISPVSISVPIPVAVGGNGHSVITLEYPFTEENKRMARRVAEAMLSRSDT